MLWQKGWWETRRGILTILGGVLLFAAFQQPWKQADLSQWISSLQGHAPGWSENSRRLLPLLSGYYGYVWSHWFKSFLLFVWPFVGVMMTPATLFAGSCPWLEYAPGAAGLFTFSLPVSRRRVLLSHA